MKHIFLLLFLTSCGAMPQIFQSAENVLDDTAVKVELSKEAMGIDKEVSMSILITNPRQ